MRDEVDDLVEAWARERDDLDLGPVAVFSRISRLAHHVDRARRQAFTAHDIESWEFDVLAALRRAGRPYELSPGRLLRETLVTSGTMTNRVDRLAIRGLVERHPDPSDRRGVLVRELDVVPHARTQSLGVRQGPLQRRLDVATFVAHSTQGPIAPSVAHLPTAVAGDLLDRQAERGRAARAARGDLDQGRWMQQTEGGPR